MTGNNDEADTSEPRIGDKEIAEGRTVDSPKVEDLRTIEDRTIRLAEPHFREGGVLARLYADRPRSQAVFDFVSNVKDVARMIQEDQRLEADPAYTKRRRAARRLRAEFRRQAEASKGQR